MALYIIHHTPNAMIHFNADSDKLGLDFIFKTDFISYTA